MNETLMEAPYIGHELICTAYSAACPVFVPLSIVLQSASKMR